VCGVAPGFICRLAPASPSFLSPPPPSLPCCNPQVILSTHVMQDRLKPEEVVDLPTALEQALNAIQEALRSPCRRDSILAQPGGAPAASHAGGARLPTLGQPALELHGLSHGLVEEAECSVARPMAVLVNCDLGHNRSPTLVLASLLRMGMSLREAYRAVLRVRPTIDPLPNYRRYTLSNSLTLSNPL